MTGHLATITSQDENDFIVDKLDPTYNSIGSFQPDGSEEPAGGWQWITGENQWRITNWNSSQPNNHDEEENKLHFYNNGLWIDNSNNSLQDGYIVEYEETNFTVPVPPVSNFSSTGSPTSWKWHFGDGTNSTEQNPTHLYSKTGQYAVTLSVSNVAGSNSITKLNYISVGNSLKAPVTSFSISLAHEELAKYQY